MAQFPILEWLNQFVTKFTNSMAVPIEIECEVSPKDMTVLFNSGQLEQVLTNLCENGLRYSEKATGSRHIIIEVKNSDIDGNPEMHIMDDGKGIPEELTSRKASSEIPEILENLAQNSGNDGFVEDLTVSGPLIGARFRF